MPVTRDQSQLSFDLGTPEALRAAVRDAVLGAVATATYAEVADAFGVSRGAVSGIVTRARCAGAAVGTRPPNGSPADVARRAAAAICDGAAVQVRLPRPARALSFQHRGAIACRSVRSRGTDMWSVDDQDVVRRRVPAGDDIGSIARDLGRTTEAVRRRATILGVSKPRRGAWTPALDAVIVEGRARGLDDAAIGVQVGRSAGAVLSRLSRLREDGVDVAALPTSRVWTAGMFDRVAVMHRAGRSIADIAEAVDRSTASVADRVQGLRDEGRLPGARLHDESEPGAMRRPKPGADPLLAALFAAHGSH